VCVCVCMRARACGYICVYACGCGCACVKDKERQGNKRDRESIPVCALTRWLYICEWNMCISVCVTKNLVWRSQYVR